MSYFPIIFYLFTYFIYFSSINLSINLYNHLILLINISIFFICFNNNYVMQIK